MTCLPDPPLPLEQMRWEGTGSMTIGLALACHVIHLALTELGHTLRLVAHRGIRDACRLALQAVREAVGARGAGERAHTRGRRVDLDGVGCCGRWRRGAGLGAGAVVGGGSGGVKPDGRLGGRDEIL
jgi:hypothetical protein